MAIKIRTINIWSWQDQAKKQDRHVGWCKKLSSEKQFNENEKRGSIFFIILLMKKVLLVLLKYTKNTILIQLTKAKRFVAIDVKALKKLKYPVTR